MGRVSNGQRNHNNINNLDSTDLGAFRKILDQIFKSPALSLLATIGSAVALLTLLSLFNYYPIPIFEKVVDPHMYYIKEFVHSLPLEVQDKMSQNAEALGIDIYEYNMQMCGYSPDSYWDWWKI